MIASAPRSAAAIAASGARVFGPENGAGTDAGGATGGANVDDAGSRRPRDALPDALAVHIAMALRQLSGLEIDLVGARSVERAVGERIQALIASKVIADPWSYPARIEQDADERQWLIEAAVVPETWFFRHRESFDFLALQARQRHFRGGGIGVAPGPLRIASVPCSTGEEPYSIAMTLLLDGLPPSAFLIDAMDISEVALAQAAAGRYRPNAFRGCPEALRDRFFTLQGQLVPGSPIRESIWEINREARACVSFQRVNLVSDARVGGDTGQGGTYDFIFCRNVLIYFDRPTQAAVIEKLRRALRPGGFLLVGPAEAALVSRVGLAAAAAPLAFAFHRDVPAVVTTSRPIGIGSAMSGRGAMSPDVPSVAKQTVAVAQGVSGAGVIGVMSPPKPGWTTSTPPSRGGQTGASLSTGNAAPLPFEGAAGRPANTVARATGAANPSFGAPRPVAIDSVPRASGNPSGGVGRRVQAGNAVRASGTPAPSAHAVTIKMEPLAATYAEAERLANLGYIAQATQLCQTLVDAGMANADVYCLMGVLADAGNRSADAREHFRRALYLEANHAGALVHFAEHLALEGDDAGAQRLMARARRAHPDLF